MVTLRKFSRRILVVSNGVAVILFLLACANALLHPGKWWFISLLGLIFPLLLLIVTGFLIFWLFFPSQRRWAWFSLVALVIGWPNIHVFLAFHPFSSYHTEKAPNAIRVLTWNVRSWDEFITKKPGSSGHRSAMMDFIAAQQPDVLCLQEFFESHNPKELPSNIPYISQQLHYPYYFFSRDYRRYDGVYEAGVILFSRLPIVDSLLVRYARVDGLRTTESLIAADLKAGRDTIRVFTTHLQSVLFHSKDFHDLEIIKDMDDSMLQASKSIAKKLRYAFRHRADQALEVQDELDKSPYPSIICGDFNDVPNSYTYFTIKGDRQDAFIARGFGIGRSYTHISPTLRIDYILADQDFDVLQCRNFRLPYSDHHPVIADLQLP